MGRGMKGHAMKVAAILVTAALAVGTSAFGQTRDGESIGQKADRIFDRMENATRRGIDKVRGTGNKAEDKLEDKEARRDDTRAMGAGKAGGMQDRSDQRAGSGDRQTRMDDAYSNWKNQQKR